MRGGFARAVRMGAREQDMQRKSSSRWSRTVLTFAFVVPLACAAGADERKQLAFDVIE